MKTRILIISVLLTGTLIISCSDESEMTSSNGFKIAEKFYPTPYGSYASSGGTNDYEFDFFDKEFTKDTNGNYQLVGLEGNTLNGFVMADLTLEAAGVFVGEYFYDPSESLPRGIDDLSYIAEQSFDNSGNAINPPTSIKVTNATVKIISKKGQTFEIEYEATFNNGVKVAGQFKGQLTFRQ